MTTERRTDETLSPYDLAIPEPLATRGNVISAMRHQGSTYKQIGKAIGLSGGRVIEIQAMYKRHLIGLDWYISQIPTGKDELERLAWAAAHGKLGCFTD